MRNAILSLSFAYIAVLFADENPVAVSEAVVSSLDTTVYESHSVKNLDAPVSLYRFSGATITARNLDSGIVETLVEDASLPGCSDWAPSSGGVWELVNIQDGTAKFTVRYSLFGNKGQGSGSSDSPLKIVDSTEVDDIVKSGADSDGFVFTVAGGGTWSADMVLPEGFSVSALGEGRYMLEPVSDGKVYGSAMKTLSLYTDGTAPNRRMRIRDVRHISYSGDNWLGGEQAGSELTLLSPLGASDSVHMFGTGLKRFAPSDKGQWKVSLVTEDYMYEALIDVLGWGTAISIR